MRGGYRTIQYLIICFARFSIKKHRWIYLQHYRCYSKRSLFFLFHCLFFEITRSKLTFFLSLLFSAASFFYTHYSIIPITDAPAASLLLISFWFLFRYLNSEIPRFKNWVFFSILLAIATILRPYFGAIFILVAAILLFKYRLPVTNVFKKGAVYAIALFFFLAPWIIRNYSRSGKLMIFQQ